MKVQIFFFFSLLFLGCSEEKTPTAQLPPETQVGANTFGCYIDGKLLIPRDGSGTFGGGDDGLSFLGGYPNGAYNEIDIRDYKSDRTAKMLIHIQSLRQIGVAEYVVDESNGMSNIDGHSHNYIHCRVFDSKTNSYQYYRSFENSGIIKITRFDPYIENIQHLIVSGTFSCKLRNSGNPTDEIEITQGLFDINGYTLPNKVFP